MLVGSCGCVRGRLEDEMTLGREKRLEGSTIDTYIVCRVKDLQESLTSWKWADIQFFHLHKTQVEVHLATKLVQTQIRLNYLLSSPRQSI